MLKTARHMEDDDSERKENHFRPFYAHPENTSVERPLRHSEAHTLEDYSPKSTYSSN